MRKIPDDPMDSNHRPRAFTLIELIVVIAIIVILIIIFHPIYARAREAAHIAQVRANQKQIRERSQATFIQDLVTEQRKLEWDCPSIATVSEPFEVFASIGKQGDLEIISALKGEHIRATDYMKVE